MYMASRELVKAGPLSFPQVNIGVLMGAYSGSGGWVGGGGGGGGGWTRSGVGGRGPRIDWGVRVRWARWAPLED